MQNGSLQTFALVVQCHKADITLVRQMNGSVGRMDVIRVAPIAAVHVQSRQRSHYAIQAVVLDRHTLVAIIRVQPIAFGDVRMHGGRDGRDDAQFLHHLDDAAARIGSNEGAAIRIDLGEVLVTELVRRLVRPHVALDEGEPFAGDTVDELRIRLEVAEAERAGQRDHQRVERIRVQHSASVASQNGVRRSVRVKESFKL